MLTEKEINRLLDQKPITKERPWSTGDEQAIDKNIEAIVVKLCKKHDVLDKTEYEHYGSGYASFVDCWLYRPDDEFRFEKGNCFWGLVVLFSRLSKYFVLGEGQKTWHKGSGSSYVPSFEFVDVFTQNSTKTLERLIFHTLERQGLVRLHANDLAKFLRTDIRVPTILSDPPWRHFDALFYWED